MKDSKSSFTSKQKRHAKQKEESVPGRGGSSKRVKQTGGEKKSGLGPKSSSRSASTRRGSGQRTQQAA